MSKPGSEAGDVLVAHAVRRTFAPTEPGGEPVAVLHGCSLTLAAGERVALVGPSGSGKSTLLALLAGLDHPSSGSIHILGTDLATLSPSELARFRGRHLGFVFQSHRLLPHLTALENVSVPLELIDVPAAEARSRAAEMLQQVGLAQRQQHRPAQMSGGEQQRVAIARALASRPALLVADEPTGNLDGSTGSTIAKLLLDPPSHGDRPAVLLVTHDEQLAQQLDRVVRMRDGQLIDQVIDPLIDQVVEPNGRSS
jgi:predicted ABC-type transport system involved in lysophospholipase L1 biosynthesis ATPase subunit